MATLELDLRHALRGFDLALNLSVGAEVVALVGPSGAGKTTVLRCVAGLLRSGRIVCDGVDWSALPPERRSVGYVPQHHALFPHLTVAQNVAFGGGGSSDLLERFGLGALAGERPAALSGGERQRVALARALARRPDVLLLDEPLAALDAHTRRIVRDELGDELRALGLPTLLVTHDFGDAAALADRVAVLVDGTLRQVAPPAALVEAPADAFVVALTGGFVLQGVARDGRVVLEAGGVVGGALVRRGGSTAGGGVDGPAELRAGDALPDGPVRLGLHPWDVDVAPGPGPRDALRGVVRSAVVEGRRVRVRAGGWWGEADVPVAAGDEVHGVVRRARLVEG